MSLNLNKIIIAGRLTKDPELRTTTSGKQVASFGVAVNRRTARDEERKADFFFCKAWGSTAEFVNRNFHKGNAICVYGRLQFDAYQGKDGQMVRTSEVIVDEALFVESKSDEVKNALNTEDAPNFEDVTEDSDLPF